MTEPQGTAGHLATGHVATGHVATDAAARYAKQLVSHLGRRAEVRDEGDGVTRIVFVFGACLLLPHTDELELRASADNAHDLDLVKDVVGRHLERFGQRNELGVDWQ